MKKLKSKNRKYKTLALAMAVPLSVTGVTCGAIAQNVAKADSSSTANYYSGCMKEVSLSNNNFNSGSSTHSISTSLSGWTGQMTDKKTTAGIINTGNSFQTYMASTYRLSKNPLAKATDKNILMINSKTADSNSYSTARQGYKSNSVTLDANSFYSFQASFKSDTNYNSKTVYVEKGTIGEEIKISLDVFNGKKDGVVTSFGDDSYISFTYKSTTYYLLKNLTEGEITSTEISNAEFFYEDDSFVGLIYNSKPVYIAKTDVTSSTETGETLYSVASGTQTYTCHLEYDQTNKNFKVATGTKYYQTKTDYTSLNDYVFGSVYLSGLKDKDGNPVKADYVQVTSKEWVTFYFFVATGNESQTVTLDLWLGSNESGHESSGVVFFDDCHIYQYSENTFWKTYQSYMGKKFSQQVSTAEGTELKEFDCTSLIDLRNKDVLDYSSHNFDFEEGIYSDDGSALKKWTMSGNGNAQVFSTQAPQYFKSITGYDFVGSTLSCDASLLGEELVITPNNYALALWTNNGYVNVKSNDIEVQANQIYKITASYKISELSSGNVYLFVEENDTVLDTYTLKESQYSLLSKTASSGATSNGSSEFDNNYGTIEFYVKGGVFYKSSINLSLGLGKNDESATGCVLFDDIKVEKASTSDYENASNKVELDAKTGTPSISNGAFNNVELSSDSEYPLTAKDWTISKGNGNWVYSGVINTEKTAYATYLARYNTLKAEGVEDIDNPYYWATYANPANSYGSTTDPDNIMMLANVSENWQSLKSSNISLSANSTNRITFKYKTYNSSEGIKVTLFDKNNIKLFESQLLNSNGKWKDFDLYLKSFAGANEVYIKIDFGSADSKTTGFAYLDNFQFMSIDSSEYESKEETAEGNGDAFAVVDMSNFYLNLPTNEISDEISITPGYTGSVGSGNGEGGIVNSNRFNNSNLFFIDGESKNVFYISNPGIGSYTIKSNYPLDLEADKYYALSFKLKTNFNYTNDGVELDEEKTYSYGVSVGLSGFEYMTQLNSNEEYQTFTIYYKPTETASANLYITLTSDAIETSGSMALYDLDFKETDEDSYNNAVTVTSKSDYDLNTDRVLVSKADGSSDTENEPDNSTDEKEESATNNDLNWSILVSSLITGLAIIIAIIGYALSKVKIKKIEKKKKESYDRKSSLHIDAIKIKARKQRDEDLKEVEENLNRFETELNKLETEHKQKVVSLREKDKGQVSKETDKEFKLFAKKITVLAEKIDSLNKQIDEIKSPEYLLNLERKVYAQEEMKQRELAKISKKLNKEQSNVQSNENTVEETDKKGKKRK